MAAGIIFITDTGADLTARIHGAKACGLQYLMRRSLPVPPAFVIAIGEVERIAAGESVRELDSAVGHLISGVRGTKLAVRSGAEVSLPGAFQTILGVDPDGVAEAVAAVAASALSLQATTIATALGLESVPRSAVVVQVQMDATADDRSGAGAALSRDPIFGARQPTGSYASRTRGDLVMAGTVPVETLEGLESRCPEVMSRLASDLASLDVELGSPVEVEFVVESGQIWYLQLREIDVASAPVRQSLPSGTSILGSGRAASPGMASGALFTEVGDALDAIDTGHNVVLALGTTSPSDVEAMIKASAVITVVGGPECHAAVITRASGVPAVVSVGGLVIADDHVMFGSVRIGVGEELLVDGTNGLIASATVTP